MTTSTVDVSAVRADDDLIENLRAGLSPDRDELERSLTDLRDFATGSQR